MLALRKCLTICQGMMYPTLSAFVSLEKATPATFPSCRLAKAGPPLLPAASSSPQQAIVRSLPSISCWGASLYEMWLAAHRVWHQVAQQQQQANMGGTLHMQLPAVWMQAVAQP